MRRSAMLMVTLVVALAWPATASTASASPISSDAPDDGFDEYMALGDSYTAGPLMPVMTTGPLGGARSCANYPAYLAEYLDVTSYVDASCAGAQTRHITEKQATFWGTNPAQLDAVGDDTDLVTLGIGGNDFDLFAELTTRCPALRSHDPSGAPCRQRFTVDGTDTKMRDARRIEQRVTGVLRAVRDRTQHATIVVIGYPRILPQRGVCPEVLPFADGDYRWADRVERRLNTSLKRAARSAGARFVEMYPPSRGHTGCAGDRAWVNGRQIEPMRATAYHPFEDGMRAVAAAAYSELTGHTAPVPGVPDTQAPALTRQQQRELMSKLAVGGAG